MAAFAGHQKQRALKILATVALGLAALHLWLSHERVGSPPLVDPESDAPQDAALLPARDNRYRIGTTEQTLNEYALMDTLIDSMLVNDYGIWRKWIRNDRVQRENALYLRKIVRIPPGFAATLFNIDLKQLAEAHRWDILDVREKMARQAGAVDFFLDIGRDRTVYSQIHMLVNRNFRPVGKDLSLVVSGFGLSYDELTRAFLQLPEPIALVVPTGQQYSKIISHEARRSGKVVLNRLPEKRELVYLEDDPDEGAMKQRLYDTLEKAPSGACIVAYEKVGTLNALRSVLPRLAKRGYRIVGYR